MVECCKEVLHDIDADALVSGQYAVQPEPTLPSDNGTGFASLAVMAAEAPYRLPSSLDLARLESLLSAKMSAAADHIWALREGPSYFAETVLEYREHRQELLPDINGQQHPVFNPQRQHIFCRVLCRVAGRAYWYYEQWYELRRQVLHLQQLQVKYASRISLEKDLPEEYLDAILKFRHHLDKGTEYPLAELSHSIPAIPTLRSQ